MIKNFIFQINYACFIADIDLQWLFTFKNLGRFYRNVQLIVFFMQNQ